MSGVNRRSYILKQTRRLLATVLQVCLSMNDIKKNPIRTRYFCYNKYAINIPSWLARPHWHEDIKKQRRRSGVSIVNFEEIPNLFLLFHSLILGNVDDWVYQQRPKYTEVKVMKYARTDANDAIFTKLVKLQHENKPVSNLISMQSAGFEQKFMKSKIFIPQK